MDVNSTIGAASVGVDVAASSKIKVADQVVQQPKAAPVSQASEADALQQARAKRETQAEREQQQTDRVDVDNAVSDLNDFVQDIRRDLNFKVDDDAGKVVVQVTDRKTGEMIRQIPSEEALALAERLTEARSLLFEAKA
ncbi:flagellar protein FlaG [Aestuariirhabdus sp. Z084]|uniref:flagellar protein FlaG n=1 Tax=Aestuariirhabdus haliotis TaxID=2918751 RepID=UPI00201B3BF1|nr:flagellar protein FlaG [Aestuariirhabdus haliotis]MCL6414452.1 flagellar protein FlaG [Aestuariirhabdus haliotis]MCL6418566.1 flagellar protein FlaG [Aestuariirhabdus haliotis]